MAKIKDTNKSQNQNNEKGKRTVAKVTQHIKLLI